MITTLTTHQQSNEASYTKLVYIIFLILFFFPLILSSQDKDIEIILCPKESNLMMGLQEDNLLWMFPIDQAIVSSEQTESTSTGLYNLIEYSTSIYLHYSLLLITTHLYKNMSPNSPEGHLHLWTEVIQLPYKRIHVMACLVYTFSWHRSRLPLLATVS